VTHHLHDPPDHDPAVALTRAEREGLLRYIGYAGSGLFDVVVSGEQLTMATAKVSQLILTLRRLRDMRERGIPVAARSADEQSWVLTCYRSEVIGLRHDQALAWLNGYAAGWEGSGVQPASTFGDIRRLLTNPTETDRTRLVLLGLMHQSKLSEDMTATGAAARAGVTKKTVINALKFGVNTRPKTFDRLVETLGYRWSDPERRDGVAGLTRVPDEPGIAQLREIMVAEDEGWATYIGPTDPDEARRLNAFPLAVGSTQHLVEDADLHDWLSGLAFCRQNGAAGKAEG
jgi:hypothetical protein